MMWNVALVPTDGSATPRVATVEAETMAEAAKATWLGLAGDVSVITCGRCGAERYAECHHGD